MKKILFTILIFILNINIFANNFIKEEFYIEKYSVEKELYEIFDKDGNLIKSVNDKLPYIEDIEIHTKISYISDLHTITESKSTDNKVNFKAETKYKKKPKKAEVNGGEVLKQILKNPFSESNQKILNEMSDAFSNIEYQRNESNSELYGVKMTSISETDANASTYTKLFMNGELQAEIFAKNFKPSKIISYSEDMKTVTNIKEDFSFSTLAYEDDVLVMEMNYDFKKGKSTMLAYEEGETLKITTPISLDKKNMEIIISGTTVAEVFDRNGKLIETKKETINSPIREKINFLEF